MDQTSFDAMLEQENLSVVWVISGELNAYGTDVARDGFGGRRVHTAILYQDRGRWRETRYMTKVEPSAEQLETLLGPAAANKARSSRQAGKSRVATKTRPR